MVVLSQRDPQSSDSAPDDLADELVLTVGRPVLVVPFASKVTKVGRQAMVAWNASREATRAAHDALPLLQRADQVIVYSINPSEKEPAPGADMAAHLVEHGVNALARHAVGRDTSAGEALLAAAADHGSDLLVMGAYGHSRLRELVLGGATRHVLVNMTLPVLMSN
jgi:nucleotide-binding universal stress UspA family protein